MLCGETIEKLLKSKYPDISVSVFDSIDSTNSRAKRQNGMRFGVIIAKMQTDGRGRHGRSFYSPADTGLYMSVVLPITPQQAYEFQLTSAAAVACARAIERLCGISPKIKWVNDLYLNGRKIAGILTEADQDRVIVGIGVNVCTDTFPEDLPMAGSLGCNNISLSELAAEIASELFETVFSSDRTFMNEYRCRSMLLGCTISYKQNGCTMCGTAVNIDDSGRLVVQTDNDTVFLNSGEVDIVL